MSIVLSLNVNGIRSAIKKGIPSWLKTINADIICLQEIRAEQLPNSFVELLPNYHNYLFPAQKKGYSGVAILSKQKAQHTTLGIGCSWVDNEGRIILNEYSHLRVASIYAPSGTTGDARQTKKMEFLDMFFLKSRQWLNENKPILLCGDFNICHQAIDIHNPITNKHNSGFLPEEREWMEQLLTSGYHDIFRFLHPHKKDSYSWWSFRANSRQRNKGWRIDYQIASFDLATTAQNLTMPTIPFLSDHAPVIAQYNYQI